MRYLRPLLLCFALVLTSTAQALEVFACEPEWGALTQVLGGPRVQVHNATTGLQDPHRIEARPSLIARLRNAELLVCTGADLEMAWLPLLLRKAGNPHVQPGRPGHFLAAEQVELKERPLQVDRSAGDVHIHGNPHLHTDPRNIARVAFVLSQRLAQLDPAGAEEYAARHAAFARDWAAALQRWERLAAPLRGVPVVVQHRSWVYLSDWLGLVEVATLEPRPGLPPSAAYLNDLLARLRVEPARLVLRAAYQDPRPSEWLTQNTAVVAVELPFTVGGSPAATDLFSLFDETLARLLAALSP